MKKYLVTWKEKYVITTRNTRFVEAVSEREARELIKEGYGEVEDSYDIDSYSDEIISIESIEECPDE